MGLRPTHRDESALLTARLIPNGLCNDFRRSVMAIFHQLRRLPRDNLRSGGYLVRLYWLMIGASLVGSLFLLIDRIRRSKREKRPRSLLKLAFVQRADHFMIAC